MNSIVDLPSSGYTHAHMKRVLYKLLLTLLLTSLFFGSLQNAIAVAAEGSGTACERMTDQTTRDNSAKQDQNPGCSQAKATCDRSCTVCQHCTACANCTVGPALFSTTPMTLTHYLPGYTTSHVISPQSNVLQALFRPPQLA